jgi:hypothetical protein
MRNRGLLASAGCALLALMLPAAAPAQDGPAPFALVYATTVKLGTQPQYEAAMGKLVEAYKKAESPVKWTTFVSAIGGTGPTYYTAVPMQKLGDIDGWPPPPEVLAKAYGDGQAGEILQSMGSATQQSQTFIMAVRPELSYAPDASAAQSGPSPLGYVYTWTLKPGGVPQFEAAFTKTVEAYRKVKSPIRWTTSSTTIGGTAPGYVSIIPMQKFGDIDGWQGTAPAEVLTKAYGEAEAAKTMQSFAAAGQGLQVSIIASRPDLSNQ